MQRIIYLALTINLLLLPDPTFAAKLYKWVDKDGVVHITDNPEEIPEEHSGNIEEFDIERTDYKSMIGNLWKKVRKQKENIIFSIILLILFIFVFKSFKHLKSRHFEKRKKKLLYTLDKSGIDHMSRDEFRVYIIKLVEAQGFSTQSIDEGQIYRGIRLIAEKNKTKFLVHIIPDIDLGSILAVNEVEREKHLMVARNQCSLQNTTSLKTRLNQLMRTDVNWLIEIFLLSGSLMQKSKKSRDRCTSSGFLAMTIS